MTPFFFFNFIPFLNCPSWEYMAPGWSHSDMVYFFLCYFRPDDEVLLEAPVLSASFDSAESSSTIIDVIHCIAGSGSSPPLSPGPLPGNSAVPSHCIWMSPSPPWEQLRDSLWPVDASFLTQADSWNALAQLDLHPCTFAITWEGCVRRMKNT